MALKQKHQLIDRLFFSRWESPPTKEDVAAVDESLAQLRKQVNQPLIWVACVTATAKLANADERKNLNDLMNTVKKYSERAFLMYEGNELTVNLQRAIIQGVIIFTRAFNDFLVVVKNGDAAAKDLTAILKKDAAPFVKQAKDAGIII